jgi:hypothetical protein
MISEFDKKLKAVATYPGVPEARATRTAASTIVGKRTRTNMKAMEKATRAMVLNKRLPTQAPQILSIISIYGDPGTKIKPHQPHEGTTSRNN